MYRNIDALAAYKIYSWSSIIKGQKLTYQTFTHSETLNSTSAWALLSMLYIW